MKQEFSITFWISPEKNPSWLKSDSEISFPPFTVKNGVRVYFKKQETQLKIYILHPEVGYRKIVADIDKYIGSKCFVALTNTKLETKLYLNAHLVKSVKREELLETLEVGDYVMVETEENNLGATMPAKVDKIVDDEKVVFDFFEKQEVKTFSKEKVVY